MSETACDLLADLKGTKKQLKAWKKEAKLANNMPMLHLVKQLKRDLKRIEHSVLESECN